MSHCTVLLTSFAPWKAHQPSNSSDDLLLEMVKTGTPSWLHLLRQLPVNVPVAKEIAIGKIQQLQPQTVICCGMAESRTKLNVESKATVRGHSLHTRVDLEALTVGLNSTEISDDAGRFVCNGLYYAILYYLQNRYPDILHSDIPHPDIFSDIQHPDIQCLFVHVPILTPGNRKNVIADFSSILKRVPTI